MFGTVVRIGWFGKAATPVLCYWMSPALRVLPFGHLLARRSRLRPEKAFVGKTRQQLKFAENLGDSG